MVISIHTHEQQNERVEIQKQITANANVSNKLREQHLFATCHFICSQKHFHYIKYVLCSLSHCTKSIPQIEQQSNLYLFTVADRLFCRRAI